MTRDLLIVSERALTATDLAAGVSAVHRTRPWQVTDNGHQLAVQHEGHTMLLVSRSVRVTGNDGSRRWRTSIKLVDAEHPLGMEVARAVAWQTSGELSEVT